VKTATALQTLRQKELAQLARDQGIGGWHAMRKDELIRALTRVLPRKKPGKATKLAVHTEKTKSGDASPRGATATTLTPTRRRIRRARRAQSERRELATDQHQSTDDRIVLMVRDAFWLQAIWELQARSVERAQAALAELWHTARPVLRLSEVSSHSSNQVETVVRDIPIHGAVRTWFIEVDRCAACFRVEIGYTTTGGRFYSLARSNLVTTPQAGTPGFSDVSLTDIAENSERIFAMSGGFEQPMMRDELRKWMESRLQRPLGSPLESRFGNGARGALKPGHALEFSLDADMVVYGSTDPSAYVTIGGEPVKLPPDGSFTARLKMPDRRQVIPVIASSRDGVEEHTIVLAVERNTKVMEPRIRESGC
jgi:hypothetical protein